MKSIILILIILFCCCRREGKQYENVIDVLAASSIEIKDLSDIATDIEYIPLETLDSSLVGNDFKLVVKGDYFYLSTISKILCFDKKGKYLFNLNKNGRGPEEYEWLGFYNINNRNTLLALGSEKDIIVYNQTQNGFTFRNRFKIDNPNPKIDFIGSNDNLLLQYPNHDGTRENRIELRDLKGLTLKSYPNNLKYSLKDAWVSYSIYENSSYEYDNKLFIKELQNDTVFQYSELNTLKPYLVFNTKDKRVTPEARSNGFYYSNHTFEYVMVKELFDSERYCFFSYSFNKKSYYALYDKVKKIKYRVPEKTFFEDDISGGINFAPKYCYNGFFYSWVEAYKLKEFFTTNNLNIRNPKNIEKNKLLRTIIDRINDSDNPILIEIKIKK